MPEITKAVGQWIVSNVGWTVVIALFILSCLFKITKIEIDPLGMVIGWIGKMLTKDVRKDVADLRTETNSKIDELKTDYNMQIADLKKDLDAFEKMTNTSINDIKKGTSKNCELLKKRLDGVDKSNDMQTVRQIKTHVLDFANSCLNKRKHTKRDFDNIIEENAEYERLVKKYKLVNDVYKEDFAFIMKCYHKCQDEGTFLKESDAED